MPAERIIKKYPNRRLYDTGTSAYITIADVRDMIAANETVKVVDAKTGEDLTHQTMLQIICEAEGAGSQIFSTNALAEFIRLYGSAMQGAMSNYIDANLSVFIEAQKRFNSQAASLAASGTNAPQAWAEFLGSQGPAMRDLMNAYLEQNGKLAGEVQKAMQQHTQKIIDSMNFAKKKED